MRPKTLPGVGAASPSGEYLMYVRDVDFASNHATVAGANADFTGEQLLAPLSPMGLTQCPPPAVGFAGQHAIVLSCVLDPLSTNTLSDFSTPFDGSAGTPLGLDIAVPSWSPDGNTLMSDNYGQVQLWDLKNATKVSMSALVGTEMGGGVFTPDSKSAFIVGEDSAASGVFRVDADSGVVTNIPGARAILGAGNGAAAILSRTDADAGTSDILVARAPWGAPPVAISTRTDSEFFGFTQDEKYVLFLTGRDKFKHGALFGRSLDAGTSRQISARAFDAVPIGGSRILYSENNDSEYSGIADLFVLDLATNDPPLRFARNVDPVLVFPSTNTIVFEAFGVAVPRWGIYSFSLK